MMRSRKRIRIQRKARKIGFLGKGAPMPSHERSEIVESLRLRIGDEVVSTDEHDLSRRQCDAQPLQSLLGKLFLSKPVAVVFPDSPRCVAEALDVCIEGKTPAVVRGGATAGLGGVASVGKTIVIDVTTLNLIVEIDAKKKQSTVQAGCTWKVVSSALRSEGLAPLAFPSSGIESTVGGWMSTGGYGIGTLQHGCFHEMVSSMEVALPSGLLVSAGHDGLRYSMRSFARTEGQMGVITRLTFDVRSLPEQKATYVLTTSKLDEATEILQELTALKIKPFHIMLMSGNLGGRFAPGIGDSSRHIVVAHFEGNQKDVTRVKDDLRHILKKLEVNSEWIYLREADIHHFVLIEDLRARGGVLAGEVMIEPSGVGVLLRQALWKLKHLGEPVYQCDVVSDERVLMRLAYRKRGARVQAVERDVWSTLLLGYLSLKLGGRPYGIGLWNTPFAREILGGEYSQLKIVKTETDRLGIVNPGRVFYLKMSSGLPMPCWLLKSFARVARR